MCAIKWFSWTKTWPTWPRNFMSRLIPFSLSIDPWSITLTQPGYKTSCYVTVNLPTMDKNYCGTVGVITMKNPKRFSSMLLLFYMMKISKVAGVCPFSLGSCKERLLIRNLQQYNRYRVSVSKIEEQIRFQFNGLVAYLDINVNLKWQSFVFFCCQI
jgi:hypothetical protein